MKYISKKWRKTCSIDKAISANNRKFHNLSNIEFLKLKTLNPVTLTVAIIVKIKLK